MGKITSPSMFRQYIRTCFWIFLHLQEKGGFRTRLSLVPCHPCLPLPLVFRLSASLSPGIMAFCNLMLAHKPEKWDDDDEPKKGQRLSGRTKKAAGGGDEQILPHYPLVLLRLELGQKTK